VPLYSAPVGSERRGRVAPPVPLAAVALLLALVGGTLLGACGQSGDDGADTDRVAGVYLAALRWAAASLAPSPPPTTAGGERPEPDDDPPTVYALGLNGEAIPVAVQAVVVKELRDDVNVRFADARGDVVDDDGVERVHDDGLLVSLGEVPETGDDVTLDAELYRDVDDDHAYQLRVRLTDGVWSVATATPR
jgi:hypothetical protein